jgi:hypothetical protein
VKAKSKIFAQAVDGFDEPVFIRNAHLAGCDSVITVPSSSGERVKLKDRGSIKATFSSHGTA